MSKEKALAIINEQEVLGKQFRVYGDFENPLFLAKDVAEWIEHNKPSELVALVDESEKYKIFIDHSDSIAGVLQSNTEYWFLTENGVYEILMQSRKPIAKQFKKKVKEILKDIRKNGLYVKPDVLDNMLSDPNTMIAVLEKYRDEKAVRIQLEQKVQALTPKAEYYDEVLNKDGLILSTVVAKDLGLHSANKLHKIMNLAGIIFKKGRTWVPYADYEWLIKNQYADFRSYKQEKAEPILMWTEKGRKYIIENYDKWVISVVSA